MVERSNVFELDASLLSQFHQKAVQRQVSLLPLDNLDSAQPKNILWIICHSIRKYRDCLESGKVLLEESVHRETIAEDLVWYEFWKP
tara:strand:- start:212 stop:472 length:261 start_codon:yes stop_codon:yes gene_type:complete